MESKLKTSINRAIALLGSETNHEAYICLKMSPVEGGCCCFHCWPDTWRTVNQTIRPCGPLEDEGDVLIDTGDGQFVLECHESGPEIILYLGLATASLVLVKSVVELITVLLKSLQNEKRKTPSKVRLSKRVFNKGKYKEEHIVEIELPLSEKAELELNERVDELLKNKPLNKPRHSDS